MATENPSTPRRWWGRRRDAGRRIVRDRRRETIGVLFERRGRADRRSGQQRREREERRSPPQGFRFLGPLNFARVGLLADIHQQMLLAPRAAPTVGRGSGLTL